MIKASYDLDPPAYFGTGKTTAGSTNAHPRAGD